MQDYFKLAQDMIEAGKPADKVKWALDKAYKAQHHKDWIETKRAEYLVLFPTTETVLVDELQEDGTTIQVETVIPKDYSEDETYMTFEEWLNEERIITPLVEAVEDVDGTIISEEIPAVTEKIRKYIDPLQTEIDILVEAKFRADTMPKVVTMRQARLALLGAGLLATVEGAILNGTDEAMKIEWEYATEVRRDWASLIALTSAMGMTSEQLNDLFISAGNI